MDVGTYEAKTRLPALLKRVQRGEQITITRHGVPVARLVPVTEAINGRNVRETIEALKQFRRGNRLAGLSIRALIERGRR